MPGSRPIIVFRAAKLRDAPPSTRYDASVHGAPQKPSTAARPPTSRLSLDRISPVNGISDAGSNRCSFSIAAEVRTGSGSSGPPSPNSTRAPMAATGTRMSEKKMTPSGSNRRKGWSDTSVARSAERQSSMKDTFWRTSRYSGR